MEANQGVFKETAEEYYKSNKAVLNILRNGHPKKVVAQQKAAPVASSKATYLLFKVAYIIGLSTPPGSWRVKVAYMPYAFLAIMLGTVYLPIAFVLSYKDISADNLDLSNLLTSVEVTCDAFSGSAKFFVLVGSLTKLRTALTVIDELDMRCRYPEEFAEIHKVVRLGRRAVMFFTFVNLNYASCTFLGALIRGYPIYALYFPFLKWRRSRHEFYMASTLEYIMLGVACMQQVFNDGYGVVYVSILRTHLKILFMRIKKLSTNPELSQEQNYEELKACIKDHQKLLEYFNIISPIISTTVFIQFFVTAIILGTTLINIMFIASEYSTRFTSSLYVILITTEIYPICYYSQCLMDDSNLLANVIFHSNWMGQNARYKQLLIVFMQRAQTPLEMTAGKLVPITLSSFVSITKFSFSLYTFIKKMNIKERFGLE